MNVEERLQKINDDIKPINDKTPFIDWKEDVLWLTSTVEEQEDEIKHRGKIIEDFRNNIEGMGREIVRLRQALEFYARKHNYAYSALEDNIPAVNQDGGEIARKELEGRS